MDRNQADQIIAELKKLTLELKRVANALAGTITEGSPFIDPYGDETEQDEMSPDTARGVEANRLRRTGDPTTHWDRQVMRDTFRREQS